MITQSNRPVHRPMRQTRVAGDKGTGVRSSAFALCYKYATMDNTREGAQMRKAHDLEMSVTIHTKLVYRGIPMTQHVLCHLRRAGWLFLSLVLVTVACTQSVEESTLAPTLTNPPIDSSTTPSSEDPTEAVVALATQAIAQSLGVDVGDVVLVATERQEFPDAALGCAQPGEVAATIVTPGYKVILSVGAAQYELHTNLDGTIVRCLPVLPEATVAGPLAPTPDEEREIKELQF